MQSKPPSDRGLAQWLEQIGEAAPEAVRTALVERVAHPDQQDAAAKATLDLLVDLEVDQETLLAALVEVLLDSEQMAALVSSLGPQPAQDKGNLQTLLNGLLEARRVWELWQQKNSHTSAEGLRRLLLVLVRDLRVVFILLARQLVQLRELAHSDPELQRSAAQLTADIHAPLANRLGIWQLKWELEDWTFRFLQPQTYRRVAKLLGSRRNDREAYIRDVIAQLGAALEKSGIHGEIAGRPKHIFSIWKKMQRKGVDFEQVYDVRAVRIMVPDIPTCYAALGVVHGLWSYIPGEFDDYIASPKGNDYRSLHTAVIGPGGTSLEVQIRTPEMHQHAEMGVAAHWRYKEGGGGDASFERKVAWMRQLLEHREDSDDSALLAGFSTDVLEDRVYVLTPKGQVVDMARGATVLDFAYQIHTDVGHRCRGAKINGRIVPLTHQPGTGDRIEILTHKQPSPRRDWLNQQQGYLRTARARTKVRNWFNRLDFEQNVRDGKEIVDRELSRLALSAGGLETLLPRLHANSVDELYAQVALGDLSPAQIARVAHEAIAPPKSEIPALKPQARSAERSKDAVVIDGVGNLLVSMAQCCHPVPGDRISGFITRGRGVRVHRADCGSLAALASRHPERVIEVQWGTAGGQRFEVRVRVEAYDRQGLLRDVGAVLAAAQISVLQLNSSAAKDGSATVEIDLAVNDFAQLSDLLGRLRALPNVIDAQRLG
ncbi:MAG: bifunctional (p)ppGpp synthetase/guanosine-3',5'-bis(diphosphate) 3'-pyrophosphohydrolase [Xanthomonadales bacterium]|nr:bifunctional (p)ppGpp synthetase/guanosine-3',5'-bis(diphosphate) 3'-pyrophosphohydrolase [Xanthomonadales bacterium]